MPTGHTPPSLLDTRVAASPLSASGRALALALALVVGTLAVAPARAQGRPTASAPAPELAGPAGPASANLPPTGSPAGPVPWLLTVRLHDAYADHPVVADVARVGYLTVETRDRLLRKGTPSDRALAIADAMGAGAGAQAMDRFVTLAVQTQLSIGPSGSVRKAELTLDKLDARAALALGWTRALANAGNPAALGRKAARIDEAGALQLLEKAVALAPDHQAPRVALALAAAAADLAQQKKLCARAVQLQLSARAGGKEPIRLAAAERVVALAAEMGKACKGKELAAFAGALQLPAPVAETVAPLGGGHGERPTAGASAAFHPFRDAFVVTAPVFKGWIKDPLVQKVFLPGGRCDEVAVAEALQSDPTGDRAIALLNASLLSSKLSQEDNADVAWWAIARRHGAIDSKDKQRTIKVKDLTGAEAMAYGYARAAASLGFAPGVPDGPAMDAGAAELFMHGKALIPANALLGPILFLGQQIDADRKADPCRARTRADGARFVVQKSALPEPAKAALLEAFATIDAGCPSPAAPASVPPPAGAPAPK